MDEVKIPHGGLVVVCDGEKSMLLRNDGDVGRLRLTEVETRSEPHPPSRDIGTDRAGRVHQSVGQGRSATEETDWHQQAEAQFLADLAKRVDWLVQDQHVESVTVIAPPRALGVLRANYGAGLRAAISAEIPKDLANLSAADIQARLSA